MTAEIFLVTYLSISFIQSITFSPYIFHFTSPDERDKFGYCNEHAGRCDFENGFCEWDAKNVGDGNIEWYRMTPSRAPGYLFRYPFRDHTINTLFGHYLYFKSKGNKAVITSPLLSKIDSTCFFTFYYMYSTLFIHGMFQQYRDIGAITVKVKVDERGRQYPVWSTSEAHGMYYEKAHVNLSAIDVDIPFKVVIEASQGYDFNGNWAIDDVSFSEGCTYSMATLPDIATFTPFPEVTEPTNPCASSDQFSCDIIKCIPKSHVCDFVKDCSDETDEKNCATCNFNGTECGWEDASEGRYEWRTYQPAYDKPKRFFRVSKTTLYGALSNKAILKSVSLAPSAARCKMYFKYSIRELGAPFSFQLLLFANATDIPTRLFQTHTDTVDLAAGHGHGDHGANKPWVTTMVSIGRRKSEWHLQFVAEPEAALADIEIDEVGFSDCAMPRPTQQHQDCFIGQFQCQNRACIEEELRCDWSDDCGDGSDELNCDQYVGRCNFEELLPDDANDAEGFYSRISTCGWYDVDIKGSDFPVWWVQSGMDEFDDDGPGEDHTAGDQSGHFVVASAEYFEPGESALFVSPPLRASPDGKCVMRFWYMITGDDVGQLIVNLRHYGAHKLHPIVTLRSSSGLVWDREQVGMMSDLDFEVVIRAVRRKGEKGFFAIDDISFTPDCQLLHTTTTTPTPDSNTCNSDTEFSCRNETLKCIPINEFCDFKSDCPNGLDEDACPSECTFEDSNRGQCGWHVNDDDGVNNNPKQIHVEVTFPEAAQETSLGGNFPPKDVTTDSKNGKYMIIYSDKRNIDETQFQISTPPYQWSTQSCLFSFSYYVSVSTAHLNDGNGGIYNLILESEDLPDNFVMKKINIAEPASQNNWKTVEFGVGRRRLPFGLKLTREASKTMDETFAIDDVKWIDCAFSPPRQDNCPPTRHYCRSTGACIDKQLICDLKDDCSDASDEVGCDLTAIEISFEGKGDEVYKGFTSGKVGIEADFEWRLASGQLPERDSLGSGPPFDNTFANLTGRYLYANWNLIKEADKKSWFISPVIRATNSGCQMRFFYYMTGEHVNQLNVITRTSLTGKHEIHLTVKRHQLDKWMFATTHDLVKDKNFQVIIEAKTGANAKDSIAIDDISFTDGCTFSSGVLPNEDEEIITTPPAPPTTPPSTTSSSASVATSPPLATTAATSAPPTTSDDSNCGENGCTTSCKFM